MSFKDSNHFQNVIDVPEKDDVVSECDTAHSRPKLRPIPAERSWQRCKIFTSDDQLFDEAIRNPYAARCLLQIATDRREIIKRLI